MKRFTLIVRIRTPQKNVFETTVLVCVRYQWTSPMDINDGG